MKKKVIAFLLSAVLASGSIVPALAAETTAETAEEAVVVEEETAGEITEESEEARDAPDIQNDESYASDCGSCQNPLLRSVESEETEFR